MSAGCRFCQIAAEKPYWTRIAPLDEELIVSFRPFGALNAGHRMFIPARHVEGAEEDPQLTAWLFEAAAEHAREMGVPFNLVCNSGAQADQTVPHLHVHYVPRAPGDGLGYRWEGQR